MQHTQQGLQTHRVKAHGDVSVNLVLQL